MGITQGITIDGASSKDLDDALWIERSDGGFLLTVLISNVANSIEINSGSDIKAKSSQFSIYRGTGGCVKPMLPRALSEDKLSLSYGEQRGVIKFTFSLDRDLNCTDIGITEDKFHNQARLNHSDVPEIISNPEHKFHSEISMLALISEKLLCRRRDAGSMAIYDIVAGWGVDEEGNISQLADGEKNVGYIIVQEIMILANTLLSAYCVEKDIPIIFRNHKPRSSAPDIMDLTGDIANGLRSGDENYLKHLKGRIALIAGKAEMDVKVKGHFGLNIPAYAYFTSPIRRYPDLVCHRQILAHIKGEEYPYTQQELIELAEAYNKRVDEVRDEKNAFFKASAAADGKRGLDDERFSMMSEVNLYRVIRVAQETSQSFPATLQKEICHRAESGSLDNKTLALVFSATGTEFELGMRERIYQAIRKAPHHATIIYQIISQKFEGAILNVEESSDGPDNSRTFYCKASATVGDISYASKNVLARSKKKAAQLATLDVLQRMIGLSNDCSERPIEKSECKKVKEVELIVDAKSPKSALLEWCQKMGFPLPTFNTEKAGADHSPIFTSEITVIANGEKHVTIGLNAGGKKESEQLAAKAWTEKYQSVTKLLRGEGKGNE